MNNLVKSHNVNPPKLLSTLMRHWRSVTRASSAASPNMKEKVLPISEMPGPRSLPIIGNVLSLLMHKDADIKKVQKVLLSLVQEYGPIFVMRMPLRPPSIFMANPDDVEAMYRVSMKNPIRDGFISLKKVRDDAVNNYFQKKSGILVENGEEWWRVRSKVQVPMMKPKNLIKYLPEMDKVTLEFMEIIAKHQRELGEMPSNFLQDLYKWSLESISLVALSKRLGCLEENLAEDSMQMRLIENVNIMFECMNEAEITPHLWKFYPTKAIRKLQEVHDSFLETADKEICETEERFRQKTSKVGENKDLTLMEILLDTEGLTRKDVVTMILDMLFAGIDTTSHTLAFALYLLARNPQKQKILQKELDSVLGDGKETITDDHLSRLSYLKSCVKESLRIFPLVLGNARLLEEDTVFSGYLVPKGYQVVAFNFAMNMNESLFARPKEYLPERWSREKPYGHIHPFASLPFSHGPRMCIGRRIAEQEIYTFLARVLHRFNVDYKYEDIEVLSKFVSAPSEPLRFEFKERSG